MAKRLRGILILLTMLVVLSVVFGCSDIDDQMSDINDQISEGKDKITGITQPVNPEEDCNHEWIDATCESPKTCSKCEAVEGEKLSHVEVVIEAVAATCTETGLTEGKKCSVCNEVLVVQETIAANGHTTVVDAAKAPTCTATGLTEGKHCSVCNEVLVVQETIAANGHTTVVDAAKAPTCTATGLTEGKHCSVCNTVLVAQETIAAKGHSYGEWTETIAPTCTTNGEKRKDCNNCNHYETSTIDALGHNLVDVVGQAADCLNPGYTAYKDCSRCDYIEGKETIDALGHDMVTDAAVAPDCLNTGLTEGSHCSRCDHKVAQEVVPAKGHTAGGTVVENNIAADCENTGSYDNVVYCTACTVELSRETITVNALGHTAGITVVENNVAPDCVNNGSYDNVVYCTVCDVELSRETITVGAFGHNMVTDSAVVPTCTATGLTEGKHCSVCDEILVAQTVTPMVAHTPAEAVRENEVPATCTEDGSYDSVVYCSVCKTYKISSETITIKAGHNIKDVEGKKATCTEDGYTAHKSCTRCDYVEGKDTIEKLGHITTKFTGDFLYRVGNQNAVQLSSLFDIGKHTVELGYTTVAGNASVTVNGTSLKFNGTGRVKVTLATDCSCDECDLELTLEVVDATNATSATSATSNNVVLLNDCGFSSLEVSGGYTLYGNSFTMTCGSDSAALDMGYAFVTLNNGTLDNVQIICPNFDYAVLYKSNMTESGNRSQTTDKTRYYNVKSGIMVSGNSQILNSRISGARAAVNVTGGNCLIDNSRIEGGAVASLLVGSANSVTLRDVTLVQKPTPSTYDSNKVLMGFSVLFICDSNGNAAPITIEGTLVQDAWVNESYKQYVPSAGQSIINTVLGKTEYLHDIDNDGTKESVNLGLAFMPESEGSSVKSTNITDNRSNKDQIPYQSTDISLLGIFTTKVYSYLNSKGTVDSFKNADEYKPNKYGDIITVNYSDNKDGLESGKSFETSGWVYELNVDLDKASGYKLDFSKLTMIINGVSVTDYKVNGGNKPSTVSVTAGGVTYTLTATINGKEYTATFKVTGTETSKESPSKISGPTTAGFGVAGSYGGDWTGGADVLTGVKIKYWSVAENKFVEFDFSNFTVPGSAGKLNGTNSYWEYTHTNNDFTLKVTNTVAIHSGKSVYGMPIRGTDGKLYFTISSTNGYVGSGTTSRAITMQYEFTDNNGGDKLTFTHTFNISYDKDNQYKYSDLCNGTLTKLEGSSGGGGCVTPDTLITLADGTQIRMDEITGDELFLVWNMETGKFDAAQLMFMDVEDEAEFEVVYLIFSDGTEVKVIYEHGFWDYDLNRYVYLDTNAADYIGHTFAKQNGDTLEKVQLVDVVIKKEVTTAWSPVTVEHLCYFVNGMLSMPGGVGGLFNIFEIDPETMTYDYEQMKKDIETYGLFTYEELNEICPLSEDMFYAANGAYLKVSIGKGNLTIEELKYMINRYSIYLSLRLLNE